MKSHFTVVYDACVLYPAPLRDFLMWLALTDTFRARWTEQIHEEWMRGVLRERPELQEQLKRTRDLMNSHVRDSLVTGYEHLIETLDLPDADDRHVMAAALHCGASLIVTANLKDFPEETLRRYQLAAEHPDDFICNLFDLHPAKVVEAARSHRKTLKKPPKTVDEYLDCLLKQGLTQTVDALREFNLAI